MTWTASLLPDDALPPDSLVKRIIDADKVQPEAMAAAMEFMDAYDSDLQAMADRERAELPLWRVMHCAYDAAPNQPGEVWAAEIEALRDHMAREVDKPLRRILIEKGWVDDFNADTLVRLIQRQYSSYFTKQARIARGDLNG